MKEPEAGPYRRIPADQLPGSVSFQSERAGSMTVCVEAVDGMACRSVSIEDFRRAVSEADPHGLGGSPLVCSNCEPYAECLSANTSITFRPMRAWHVPRLWYWRKFLIPVPAMQNPRLSLFGLLRAYFDDVDRPPVLLRIIYANETPIGYLRVSRGFDLSILIGPPEWRRRGVGTMAVRYAAMISKRRSAWLYAGSYLPEPFLKMGFEKRHGGWVLDHGVMRLPMVMKLREP